MNHVKRFTLEETIESQEVLRNYLDELVSENRPLEEDERGDFLKTVSRALLGQGTGVNVFDQTDGYILHDKNLSSVNCNDVETFLRTLAYFGSEKIKDENGEVFEIRELWKAARQACFKVFPLAVAEALRASPERLAQEKQQARTDW